MKPLIIITFLLCIITSAQSQTQVKTIDQTKKCLLGYDWLIYENGSVDKAWKFSKDGTFNYSQMSPLGSLWGKWSIPATGKIMLVYTKNSGIPLPTKNEGEVLFCEKLKINDLIYTKE